MEEDCYVCMTADQTSLSCYHDIRFSIARHEKHSSVGIYYLTWKLVRIGDRKCIWQQKVCLSDPLKHGKVNAKNGDDDDEVKHEDFHV